MTTATATTLKEQIRLLNKAESSGEPLAHVLSESGWSYDDLVYQANGKRSTAGSPPELNSMRIAKHDTPVVSFFTGCGGMDLGLESVGFKHVAAFEINELCCKTLRKNRPSWKVFGPPLHAGDVSKFVEVSTALTPKIKTPFEGVFVGGPPCQPFSIAANQRFAKSGDNFKRIGFSHETNGSLFNDFLRLIIEFKPKAFVVENVPGLRDLDDGEQLRIAIKKLQDNGYAVAEPFVLDAANFGVPQHRTRLFVVGSRGSKAFKPPAPHKQTYGAGSVLGKKAPALPNSETREHHAESILRYMRLGYGQRDQLGRVDRLDPSLPSKTVIAGGTKGGGRSHLHPQIPRTLSVRECARLQTFPDTFEFVGSSARQFTQVGNAVPPLLAAHIGRSVVASYFS